MVDGLNSNHIQNMEFAPNHLSADNPPTQTLASEDEQLDIETGIKLAPSLIPGLFTSDEKRLRDESSSTHQAVNGSLFDNEQQHTEDVTKNQKNQSANPDITMILSSSSCSEMLHSSFQTHVVGKMPHVNEQRDENNATESTQNSLLRAKVEIAESHTGEVVSTDIVGWSAKNLQQLSENIVPSTAPVTALAPSLEPTAAICEVSLETSQIKVNADAGIFLSDHTDESLLPSTDAGKPRSSGAFSGLQTSTLENFAIGKETTLAEPIQNSKHSEADQVLATHNELTPSKYLSLPDGSLTTAKEAQELEADASTHIEEPAQGGPQDLEAEFELDLSPIESSSSDASTGSSSSNESDDDDDYKMLDPAEQAARLMQEDGGSDDEGAGKGNHGAGVGPPRTLNEKPDEVVPKPNLIITENMKIVELGQVENLVENLVLIKAKTSGEYQVLEFGSVLCLEDRIVIGVVAETLGRVEQPYYAVHFTNAAAIAEAGISNGTKIFYVEQHSTTVFTQPLKTFKGSDASNLHDEEVGDEGIEFSDDEAEAEYKRKLKLTKQAKRDIREGPKDNFSQRGRQRSGKTQKLGEENHSARNGTSRLDYNDPEAEDLYTPLARPSNLHEIMGRSEAPLEDHNLHHRADRGSRGGRGRGDRGRGRNDRDRGNRGYRGHRGSSNGNGRMVDSYRNRAQAPGNGVGQRAGGTDVHPLPSTNNFLPPRPAPADTAFPSSPIAGQTGMGPPIHQSSPQQMAHHNPSNQSNNHRNPPYQQQPSFYAPQPQPSYNPSQSQPPHYQPQPQSSQYIPPSPQYQQPMLYPQYHYPSQPTPNVPPGTFVNPAFFLSSAQPAFPNWPQLNPAQQPPSSAGASNSGMSPEAERVFHALNVLKNLSSGDGSHPT
jgi:H/ACA ribonucleoprotein complex non-core subunit NAF1